MASSSSSNGSTIKLKSFDGEVFEVDEAAAVQSQTVRHLIEDGCADAAIPLPNVTGKVLAKVVEFLKKHAGSSTNADDDIKSWDAEFAKLDVEGLCELILAANYLDIKDLMNLASQTVADMIKDKSVEEVRAIFDIENDFTPKEEEEVRKENQWAFQ